MGWGISNSINKTGRMIWSQFSIKILGVPFANSVLDNSIWDKLKDFLTKRKKIFRTDCNS